MQHTLENFQEIIEKVHIFDIYLKKSVSYFDAQFNPSYVNLSELPSQSKFFISDIEVIESDSNLVLQVIVEAGHRYVVEENSTEPQIAAVIEADIIAEYKLDDQIDPEFISGFADEFVTIHVWPFWREYLSSQSNRLRIPCPILPLR